MYRLQFPILWVMPYTHEYYVKLAKDMESMGADSICVKDMAGLLVPYEAESLVRELKANVKVPIELHTHYTSGVGVYELHACCRGRLRYHRYRNVSLRTGYQPACY